MHRREDDMFVLTHIPTGFRVTSTYKKRNLIKLLNHPEFAAGCWREDGNPTPDDVKRLSGVVKWFYEENGWDQ